MYGGFDSNLGRAIRVQLNACVGKSYCKSKEEINEFLKFKFFVLVSNQILFDSSKYGKESIVEQARVNWIMVNNQI